VVVVVVGGGGWWWWLPKAASRAAARFVLPAAGLAGLAGCRVAVWPTDPQCPVGDAVASAVRRGAWARVTIDRRRHLSLSACKQCSIGRPLISSPTKIMIGGRGGRGAAQRRRRGRLRARSHRRARTKWDNEYVSESGMMWMSGGARRQCGPQVDLAARPAFEPAESHRVYRRLLGAATAGRLPPGLVRSH
jgi:hypothetical protein